MLNRLAKKISYLATTEEKLDYIADHLPLIAQAIFEAYYLQPFDSRESLYDKKPDPHKEDLYALPVERVGHGVQHASRVAVYIPILLGFLRSLNLTIEDDKMDRHLITLLQLTGLFHDCARKNDKNDDRWEQISRRNLEKFLRLAGISEEFIQRFSPCISHQQIQDVISQMLFQGSDSADIMRSKRSLQLELMDLYQYLSELEVPHLYQVNLYNDADHYDDNRPYTKPLLDLLIEIRAFIAYQHDLKHPCEIKFVDTVLVAGIPATRDPNQPQLKQKYEQAPYAYALQLATLEHFPLLKQYYLAAITMPEIINCVEQDNLDLLLSEFHRYLKEVAQLKFAKNSENLILSFDTKENAEACLLGIKQLLGYKDPTIYDTDVKEDKEFLLFSDQWDKLRSLSRKNAASHLPEDAFYLKTIRGDENNYYFQFIDELVDPHIRYNKRLGWKRPFTVTGQGVFTRRDICHQSIPQKTSLHSEEEKAGFTKAQSLTKGFPDMFPSLFGETNRENLLAGFIFHPDHILLTRRLFTHDVDTTNRHYTFKTGVKAETYYTSSHKHNLFSNNELQEYDEAIRKGKERYSEPLGRIGLLNKKQPIKISSFIGSDNIESRLLAKAYADYFTYRAHAAGYPISGGQIPVIFYCPDLYFKNYTSTDYLLDRIYAQAIFNDEEICWNKFFYHQFEFLFALTHEQAKTLCNKNRKELPFFASLIAEGYIHLFRFLMFQYQLTMNEVLGDRISTFKDKVQNKLLYHAIRCRDSELADYLFDRIKLNTFEFEDSVLEMAAQKGMKDSVDKCLSLGLHNRDNLKVACKEAILQNNAAMLNCLFLAYSQNFGVREEFFAFCSEILISAAHYGHLEVLQLLTNDFQEDLLDKTLLATDAKNHTVLSLAVKFGYHKVVEHLLTFYRNTPVMIEELGHLLVKAKELEFFAVANLLERKLEALSATTAFALRK